MVRVRFRFMVSVMVNYSIANWDNVRVANVRWANVGGLKPRVIAMRRYIVALDTRACTRRRHISYFIQHMRQILKCDQ